jgi:hypothetical protein
VKRGLDLLLARQVAIRLMEHDALGAHARDELGLSEMHTARPLQAALASAITFAVGAALPLLMALISPSAFMIPFVAGSSLVFLALWVVWLPGPVARTLLSVPGGLPSGEHWRCRQLRRSVPYLGPWFKRCTTRTSHSTYALHRHTSSSRPCDHSWSG